MTNHSEHFFTLSLDMLSVTGFDGYFKELNPAWEATLGWTREELKAQPYLAFVHPDDQVATTAEAHKLRTGTETVSFENRYRCKDGTYKWLLWSASPSHQERLLYSVARDITSRKRNEDALQLLRDIAVMANETTGIESALQYAIDRLCAYTGWPVGHVYVPADDDSGELAPTVIWSLAEAKRCDAFRAVTMATRFAPSDGLLGRVFHTGKPSWINDASQDQGFVRSAAARQSGLRAGLAFPVLSGTEVLAVLEFFAAESAVEPDTQLLDTMEQVGTQLGRVIERARAARELERTAVELRRSNEELQQFAYVASHDLQEPLRSIAGYVQLLERRYRGQLDASAEKFISRTVAATKRMQELIDDLLAYSRVGTRGKPFAATDCQVILETVRENLASAIAESSAQIVSESLPTVEADAQQLLQLFQNLVSNAIKFRRDEPPVIRMWAERAGNAWRFAIQDNGIGVDPQYAERIFLIFQRLHARRLYSGTGIGLALCKKIVERHGGQIWVETVPDQGSTFFFTLPDNTKDHLP